MGEKVTFDPSTYTIFVTKAPIDGVVEIDVQIDLYSDGKEDWASDPTLIKFPFPLRSVGGDPLPGSKNLGRTYFLSPLWRIKPYEASHTMRVIGNFYMEDGTSPFISTDGTYTVAIESQVSNLVDSTIAQMDEIEYSSYQNKVWVDVNSDNAGIEYPVGTRKYPVNNIVDAVSLAHDLGFGEMGLLSNVTLVDEIDLSNFVITGYGSGSSNIQTVVSITTEANTYNTHFKNCFITGTIGGRNLVDFCTISNLDNMEGLYFHCTIVGPVKLGEGRTTFADCITVADETTPQGSTMIDIDMSVPGSNLFVRNYHGAMRIINLTTNNHALISMSTGAVYLDESITDGTIIVQGIVDLHNYATSYTSLNTVGLVNMGTMENLIFDRVDAGGVQFDDAILAIRRMLENKVSKSGDIITIYEEDGSTVWRQFDLSDEGRVPV